jgi:hypothetical protein
MLETSPVRENYRGTQYFYFSALGTSARGQMVNCHTYHARGFLLTAVTVVLPVPDCEGDRWDLAFAPARHNIISSGTESSKHNDFWLIG